jgi:hypothetical protein
MANELAALYLFCFARADSVGAVHATAVDGYSPVSIIRQLPDVCVVVSEVAQEDFCGPEAEHHMQQLSWLAPRAMCHEAVIEEVMASSPVMPVAFGTLFSSLEALAEFVERHRETTTSFLRRVAEHGEWSVRGLFDRRQAQRALTSARLAGQQERLGVMSPGVRHFAEQRISRDIERELSLWLDQTCRTIANDLAGCSADFRECDVSTRTRSEDELEEVLNWAFLLPESAIGQFRELVTRANLYHRPQGLVLQITGPWPPYRFVPALSATATP